MNPSQLLAHFDHMADAPDAVPQLRRFVLDLAVRGKLVEQDPKDEPALLLLKRIAAEKERLVEENVLRDKPEVAEITPEEAPFSRPKNWEWVRLGDCLHMVNGKAFKPTDWGTQGVPIVRIQNLNNANAPFNYCNASELEDRHTIENGTFLISWSGTPGTSFGAFIWRRGKAALNQHIFKCIQIGDAFHEEFLRLAINGRLDEMIAKAHGGVGLQHITKGTLESLVLSLPPLAEQKRIVAKVDELMALCDKLEAAQTERESRRDRLLSATVQRLNQPAEDVTAFRDHARFTLDNLPRLATRPEHVTQLRQTILNLAVRGKLVPQDPKDEPSSELIKRIQEEQERAAAAGQRKKLNVLPEVDLDLAPFDLPRGWSWARFPELGEFSRGKSRHRPRNDPSLYAGGKHRLVQTGDVARANGIIQTHTGLYNDVGLAQSRLWPKGTMCITIAANIADSAILGFEACIPDSVVGFIPASEFESARYFMFFMHTAKASLVEFAPATAQKNINIGILESVLVPLPPLAEQHRIVAKVDELISLCDRLESQLTVTQTESRRLLEAVLHEALTPSESRVG